MKPNGTYSGTSLGFSGTAKVVVYTPDIAGPPQMFGINFASGTFSVDGALIPTYAADWDFYKARGLAVRVPIKWQQMQPTLDQPLNTAIMNKLASVLAHRQRARDEGHLRHCTTMALYKDDTQVIGATVSYAVVSECLGEDQPVLLPIPIGLRSSASIS